MLNSVNDKLNILRANLEKILQEKASYIKKFNDLKIQNEKLSEELYEYKNNNNNLKKPVVIDTVSDEFTTDIDSVMMKKKIDELVRDIDNCMLLLTKE
jgi:phage regulator Rha-like protein